LRNVRALIVLSAAHEIQQPPPPERQTNTYPSQWLRTTFRSVDLTQATNAEA
jgi:hypothetical protein